MPSSAGHLGLISLLVEEYDSAIDFFTSKLGYEVSEDKPAVSTRNGTGKRWVVIHRQGADPATSTGILLAKAEGEEQKAAIGRQWAGRVGMFLDVDDFETEYEKMRTAGVDFLGQPRTESYGKVVVFRDVCGNKWDLRQLNIDA